MSNEGCTSVTNEDAPSVEDIKQKIRDQVEDIIDFCTGTESDNFFRFEKQIQTRVSILARMFFQLFLMSFQKKFNYSKWLNSGLYYIGSLVSRKVKTIYGEVRYWRNYVMPKEKKRVWILSVRYRDRINTRWFHASCNEPCREVIDQSEFWSISDVIQMFLWLVAIKRSD